MNSTHHDIPRNFKLPFGTWLIPTMGILLCILLLINTSKGTAIRFGIWMALGHIVYFSYGFWHSKSREHIWKPQDSNVTTEEVDSSENVNIEYAPPTNLEPQPTDKKIITIRF